MDALIVKVNTGKTLEYQEAVSLFENMLDGNLAETQTASALISMKLRKETPDELAALVIVMNSRKKRFDAGRDCVDTCGTGGDGKHCVNVSTACALILASMGFRVAKHGNYAQSGSTGSADILDALGLDIHADPSTSMKNSGFSFLLAPDYHPALGAIGKVRRELRVPTIFNMAGPLANPADPSRQVIGLPSPERMELYARALERLGRTNVTLYSSKDGYDEVSSTAETDCLSVTGEGVRPFTIDPSDFFETFPMPRVAGREDALRLFQAGIDGSDRRIADIFSLNTALCLHSFAAYSIADGFHAAREQISNGGPGELLRSLAAGMQNRGSLTSGAR